MQKPTLSLLLCVFVLSLLGLLMVYDTTSAEMIDKQIQHEVNWTFLKQVVHAFLGLLVSYAIYKAGIDRITRYSYWIIGFLTLLLVAVFIPKIGMELNGARRWVGVMGFSFQPSELVKIFLPIAYIRAIKQFDEVSLGAFLRSLIPFTIPLALILLEPDNGTVAILAATFVALFFVAGINWKYFAIPIAILLCLGSMLAWQLPYVRSRINVYLHPETDLLGKGHQPYQAKIAAGTGGFLGKGMGKSMQKLSYLPEARSDYIAAIYAEEFGFVGIFVLTLLYMGIGMSGFLIAMNSEDHAIGVIAAVLTFLISIQAFINLGVVSGILPSKGTNLPLFSHGGTSLIANFILVAILADIGEQRKWKKLSLQ